MANNRHDCMKRLLSVLILLALGIQPQAQDTLRTFTFAAGDMTGITYGADAVCTPGDIIGGEAADAHSFSYYSYSYWNRIADSAALYGTGFSATYPYLNSWSYQNYMVQYLPGCNDGFMLASMLDYSWDHGYPVQGQYFNTYVAFPAVTLPATVQVVEVAWRQFYRKYYDQCFVDYKVNGQWQTMEVNVTGIDVEVNSGGAPEAHYTLPPAAAQESALELRLRYYSYGRGSAYGYCWAVDDFTVISGAPNQWQVTPQHFVDGKYDIIPQGMQIPLTWYNSVRNTGAVTQTGVHVAMRHTSPTGDTSTFIDEAMPPLVNHGGFDTLVVDPRGFYNNEYFNWVINGPNYGLPSITPTNNGLPTADPGLNLMETTVASDSLTYTYGTRTYTVSTAAETDDWANGSYAWGYGNGILASGTGGFYDGYTAGGYVTDNAGESYYYMAGSDVLTLLTTGNTVPASADGQPWVFRGMEMVVAPACHTAAGTNLTPILWKYCKDENGDLYTVTVATGVADYTVTEDDYTTLDLGYLMPGQYNTLRIFFPTQPALEPNTAYFIGYTLNNNSEFALAVNATRFADDIDGSGAPTHYRYFGDEPNLALYQGTDFQPELGDVVTRSYNPSTDSYSWIYSGWNIHHAPMMRALVGPALTLPDYTVTVNTEGAQVNSIASGTNFYSDGTDNIPHGSDARYEIYPFEGYQISDILVDGTSIFDSYTDYDQWTTSYHVSDSLGNHMETYPAQAYALTLYNVTGDHTLTVTTTPMPRHSVTFNCPAEHATVHALSPSGAYFGNPCGTHSYYSSEILYQIQLDPGYQINTLTVDGVAVTPDATGTYTLAIGNTDHTLTLTVGTIDCNITAFPYLMDFENASQYQTCWLTIHNGADGWTRWDEPSFNLSHSGIAAIYSVSAYYDYDGNYIDNTPDNWLVSPALQLPAAADITLSWWATGYDNGSENYGVYLSTTGTDTTDFTLLQNYNAPSTGYTLQQLDLSAYAGQTVRIAFRHTGGSYVLLLDDIMVDATHTVAIQCTGNGGGAVRHTAGNDTGDLCGTTETVPDGFLASYDLIPYAGDLQHLYVNNVDRISDVVTHSSGTSVSMHYTYSFTVTGPTTLNPVFNQTTHPVTFTCTGDGEGTVLSQASPAAGNLCGQVDSLPQGFYASYSFYPAQGSDLEHLYVNNVDRIGDIVTHNSGTSVSMHYTYSFTVDAATTVQPLFSRLAYTVTATSSDPAMGMVTGGGNYYHDSLVTLTATPMPHYRLLHWLPVFPALGDSIAGDTLVLDSAYLAQPGMALNPLQFEADGNLEFVAVFGPEHYTVTALPNNVMYGSVEGGGDYPYLQSVTVTATAYSGYHFSMWSDGSTYNPYTFPATEDLELTAVFVSDDDTSSHFHVTVTVNDPATGEADGGGIHAMGETATLTATACEGYRFVQWNDGDRTTRAPSPSPPQPNSSPTSPPCVNRRAKTAPESAAEPSPQTHSGRTHRAAPNPPQSANQPQSYPRQSPDTNNARYPSQHPAAPKTAPHTPTRYNPSSY